MYPFFSQMMSAIKFFIYVTFVAVVQAAVPITPIPSNPGIYYEYVGKIQFATKWRKYRMQLNYFKLDHNSTELNNLLLDVLAKCPGTEQVCRKRIALEQR